MLLETNNKVTQVYTNHLGGQSLFLSSIAQNLWMMCYQAQILPVAVHHPGKVNVLADRLSCLKQDHTRIWLKPAVFHETNQWYSPHLVDLFATQDSALLDCLMSWWPDPSAIAINAFIFLMKCENPYCFPLVSCIPQLF